MVELEEAHCYVYMGMGRITRMQIQGRRGAYCSWRVLRSLKNLIAHQVPHVQGRGYAGVSCKLLTDHGTLKVRTQAKKVVRIYR